MTAALTSSATADDQPIAIMFQHGETGRTTCVDMWQVENGWERNNPRWRRVKELYDRPTPQYPIRLPDGVIYRSAGTVTYPESHPHTLQAAALRTAEHRVKELEALINTPELHDFVKGIPLEAAHQRERWGVDHDTGKTPFDWVFLIGHLATRAATNYMAGNLDKALHHAVTTAAACANWHAHMSGTDTRMRPGTASSDDRTG